MVIKYAVQSQFDLNLIPFFQLAPIHPQTSKQWLFLLLQTVLATLLSLLLNLGALAVGFALEMVSYALRSS